MINHNACAELDVAIDAILARAEELPCSSDSETTELIAFTSGLARELRLVPCSEFKSQLRIELEALSAPEVQTSPSTAPADRRPVEFIEPHSGMRDTDVLPSLFAAGHLGSPVRSSNLLLSALLHTAVLALVFSSGIWLVSRQQEIRPTVVSMVTDVSPYVLPPAPTNAGGGGGGGDHDKLGASSGTQPRFSRDQLAPPAIVIRNSQPRLPAEPTVVGPPSLTFPLGEIGDPLSQLKALSNGTGIGGGIGSGQGTGVGSGYGPGVGPGWGGGIGGGAYRVGGGVSAPRAIYDPEPEYSDEARKSKYQGIVTLTVIIDANGRVRQAAVARSLGMGLDEKALEAVRTWRFAPAQKDGQPVPVQVNIEISFRLY